MTSQPETERHLAAITLNEGESFVGHWVCEMPEGGAIDPFVPPYAYALGSGATRYKGVLALTNQRMIFVEAVGLVRNSYMVTTQIHLKNIATISGHSDWKGTHFTVEETEVRNSFDIPNMDQSGYDNLVSKILSFQNSS